MAAAAVLIAGSYTWTNGSQWYQTNDLNVNPNGTLRGIWSQTAKGRGNGESC